MNKDRQNHKRISYHLTASSDWALSFTFSNQQRLSCLNFYNQSDNQLLWWQALRQEANFHPIDFTLYLDNNNECTTSILFHFYLHNRSDNTTEKYDVEWERGARLCKSDEKRPDVINVCYSDHTRPQPYARQRLIVHSFKECFFSYGKVGDLVINYPPLE